MNNIFIFNTELLHQSANLSNSVKSLVVLSTLDTNDKFALLLKYNIRQAVRSFKLAIAGMNIAA